MELDYEIKDVEIRKEAVEKYLAENPEPTRRELTALANYLLFCGNKKKCQNNEYPYLSNQDLQKIKKKETSLNQILDSNYNGEEFIHCQRSQLGKQELQSRKHTITPKDIAENQDLVALQDTIDMLEKQLCKCPKNLVGKLKKTIIELKKDKYYIYRGFHLLQPSRCNLKTKVQEQPIDLSEEFYIDDDAEICSTGLLSLIREQDVHNLLKHYSMLESLVPNFINKDFISLRDDLKHALDTYVQAEYSLLYEIFKLKNLGKSNFQISQVLKNDYSMDISGAQVSILFGKKLPKILSQYFKKKYIEWYYSEVKKGKWKKCSKCGEVKLVHHYFFARNQLSKNDFYSVCKDCRRKTEGGHSVKWQLKK